eukprot:358169-Chlamydomonas_euryale.AAC.5
MPSRVCHCRHCLSYVTGQPHMRLSIHPCIRPSVHSSVRPVVLNSYGQEHFFLVRSVVPVCSSGPWFPIRGLLSHNRRGKDEYSPIGPIGPMGPIGPIGPIG